MTGFRWGFEGQTDTVAPTVANSDDFGDPAWTTVSTAGFVTYSSTVAFLGTVSLKTDVTTGSTACNLDKGDTASANAAAHCFIYVTAYPSAELFLPLAFRGSAANHARLQMTATGQLRNFATGITGTASTSTLSLNTWYRLESVITGAGTAATQITTNVYTGNSASVLFAVPTVSGATTAAQIDTVRWLKFGNTGTVTFYLDDIQQNIGSSVEIGPAGSNATVTPAAVSRVASVPQVRFDATALPTSVAALSQVPGFLANVSTTIDAVAVAATAAVPSVAVTAITNAAVTPAAVAATATAPIPDSSAGTTLFPTVVASVAVVPAPAVQSGQTAAPAAVARPAAVPAPVVSGGALVLPATVARSTEVPTPALGGGQTVTPGSVAAVAATPTPALQVGSVLTPAVTARVAAVPAPALSAGATAIPATAGAVAAVPGPSLAAFTASTVQPVAVARTGTVPAPTVTAITDATVTPGAVARTGTVPNPITLAVVLVRPDAVAVLAAVGPVHPITFTPQTLGVGLLTGTDRPQAALVGSNS